ncbi:hypothetical protein NXX23_14010 [Bacteroides ovatus]|nr:hypothetical protein [Bacteroides ovatus]
MVLTQKYFDGRVPAQGSLTDYDKETLKEFADVKAEVEKLLDVFKFRDAQKEAYESGTYRKQIPGTDTEPWKLAKTDMERVGTILNISLQLVANLAIAFDPFLPFSSEKLRKMLNMDTFEWSELGKDNLLPVCSSVKQTGVIVREDRRRYYRSTGTKAARYKEGK